MADKVNKVDLSRLKVKIMKDQPFFGALLHNVTWRENNQIPTAGVNVNNEVAINPDFWATLPEDQQIGVSCHEIFHAALRHAPRMFRYPTQEDQQLANMAADYLVNAMLTDGGLKLPPSALLDPKYTPDKYTLETLVDELRKNPKNKTGKQPGTGSGAAAGDDMFSTGDKPSPEEERKAELEARMGLASAVMIAKKRGNLPGMIDRFVTEQLKPKQNWKEELHEWFNVKMKDDTTWNRPNRRFVYRGMYLPTKWSEGCGHIGVCIDVSGSIGQHELAVFESELNHIFDTCHPSKVTVVYFDTSVRNVEEFDEMPVILRSCGGGGTTFSAGFDYFNEKCAEITGLVFMTDMYGTWPSEPAYPVCVMSTSPKMEAPFGKTIYADLKSEEL